MSRSWLLFLDDLISSAEKIDRLTRGMDAAEFAMHEAVLDAVLFNLPIIGESIKSFPDEARLQLSERHRSAPTRLRDLIAHRYFALDPAIIWDVVQNHLPSLRQEALTLRTRCEDRHAAGTTPHGE